MTYAIYFEFGRDTDVYQCLFIPATSLGGAVIQPTFAYKELTEARGRRVWQVAVNPGYAITTVLPADVTDLMKHEILQLEGLSVYMTSVIIDPQWSTTGSFPVEVSTSDLLALKDNPKKVPVDLSNRIKTLRDTQGFPPFPEQAR